MNTTEFQATERARLFAVIGALNTKLGTVTGRGGTEFPGITQHATQLGVHRTTLYRTLTGRWRLPGLLRRYHALVRRQGGAR